MFTVDNFINLTWDMFIDLRQEGREWRVQAEVGGRRDVCEKNISWLSPVRTQNWTENLGTCPDEGSNLQPSGAQDNTPTNWATRPGLMVDNFTSSLWWH